MKLKVGFGYDVHALKEGEKLILGGVEIENSPLGTVGHSDADVLIHAIIDAILGAANLRDIGYQYPDNIDKYKGIKSTLLLQDTLKKTEQKGYKVENIDSTICLQSPKISNYIPLMQKNLAQVMNLDVEDISIKATTTEHLGFEGRKEGVSAYGVCLLSKKK